MKQWIYKQKIGILLLAICGTVGILCACAKDATVEFVTPEELESLTEESDTEMDFSDETMERKKPESVAVTGVDDDAKETSQKIVVHVCGAVCNPGVYYLDIESRVIDAVIVAGGMKAEADSEYINLAGKLCDGDKVQIPTKAEVQKMQSTGKQMDFITSSKTESAILQEGSQNKININTADEVLLCTLPGIGSTRATAIIAYREENGRFSKAEDIMNVSGIKENSFQKIKEYITVE